MMNSCKIFIFVFFVAFNFNCYAAEKGNPVLLFFNPSVCTKAFFIDDFGISGSLGIIYKNYDFCALVDIYQSKGTDSYVKNGKTFYGDKSTALAGGGISFHYRQFINSNYLFVFPGMVGGFWRYNRHKWIDTSSGSTPINPISEDRFTMLFGGPSLISKIGYKCVFLTVEDNLLLGNDVQNLIKFGVEADIEVNDVYRFFKFLSKLPTIFIPLPHLP